MKSDLYAAINQIAAERNISREAILRGIEDGWFMAEIAEALIRLAQEIDQYADDLESLEQRLTVLEEKMLAIARTGQSEEQLLESRRELDRQLRPYRGKMTADQLAMLEKQYLERILLEKLRLNKNVACTHKTMASTIFSFGRDHGYFGRLLNQTVVSVPTLGVRKGHEISGFCFTPQDGNSLLSSVAATAWFLDPPTYEQRLQFMMPYLFEEV